MDGLFQVSYQDATRKIPGNITWAKYACQDWLNTVSEEADFRNKEFFS